MSTENSSRFILKFGDLRPGMQLKADISDFYGRLILSKGHILDNQSLWKLKMWGITEAEIIADEQAGNDTGSIDPQLAEKKQKIERELDSFYSLTDRDDELITELYQLSLERRLGEDSCVSSASAIQMTDESAIEYSFQRIDFDALENEIKLPSLPSIVLQIQDAINNPRCSAVHIADIIETVHCSIFHPKFSRSLML